MADCHCFACSLSDDLHELFPPQHVMDEYAATGRRIKERERSERIADLQDTLATFKEPNEER